MKMYTLFDLKRGKYFDPTQEGERAFTALPSELTSDRHRQVVLARTAGRLSKWGARARPRLQVRSVNVDAQRGKPDPSVH